MGHTALAMMSLLLSVVRMAGTTVAGIFQGHEDRISLQSALCALWEPGEPCVFAMVEARQCVRANECQNSQASCP